MMKNMMIMISELTDDDLKLPEQPLNIEQNQSYKITKSIFHQEHL